MKGKGDPEGFREAKAETGGKTMKIVLEQGIGYSGKRGTKAYLAKITGSSKQYGYEREYVEAETVERDHLPQLIETCKAMRAEGKTLKQIGESTGKHFTYVKRLLEGKENNNKFGRYLHEFTIERALKQLTVMPFIGGDK